MWILEKLFGSSSLKGDSVNRSDKDSPLRNNDICSNSEELSQLPDTGQPGGKTQASYEALQNIRASSGRIVDLLSSDEAPPFLYAGCEEKVIMVGEETWGCAENWFVIGDIHGDFYALYNCIEYIKDTCPDFSILFLGDLVDRGPHSLECLWYLLDTAVQFPGRVLWLAGNHDLGIHLDETQGRFISSVIPAEFVDQLNESSDGWFPARHWLGQRFIQLVSTLPRAVLFPDGLLATHGGFPHVDLHEECRNEPDVVDKIRWLNSKACLQDFTWSRICPYKKRFPNRTHLGLSYGFEDFDAFCNLVSDFFPARRLVTGHEHPREGFDEHKTWLGKALTLTGFAFKDGCEDIDAYEQYQDYLVVGRCRQDEIPYVERIPINRMDLVAFHSQAFPVNDT